MIFYLCSASYCSHYSKSWLLFRSTCSGNLLANIKIYFLLLTRESRIAESPPRGTPHWGSWSGSRRWWCLLERNSLFLSILLIWGAKYERVYFCLTSAFGLASSSQMFLNDCRLATLVQILRITEFDCSVLKLIIALPICGGTIAAIANRNTSAEQVVAKKDLELNNQLINYY